MAAGPAVEVAGAAAAAAVALGAEYYSCRRPEKGRVDRLARAAIAVAVDILVGPGRLYSVEDVRGFFHVAGAGDFVLRIGPPAAGAGGLAGALASQGLSRDRHYLLPLVMQTHPAQEDDWIC